MQPKIFGFVRIFKKRDQAYKYLFSSVSGGFVYKRISLGKFLIPMKYIDGVVILIKYML